MDVLTVPTLKKDFRILFNRRGKLTLVPITVKEANWKLCRVENKKIVKGKQIQLNLHDGRNKIVEKNEYNTGDVLKLSFKDQKIEDIYKFQKGTVSIIIGGSHIGEIADIEELEFIPSTKPNLAKPVIELPEVRIQ
jgi:small subunit ribosomal protein S4e